MIPGLAAVRSAGVEQFLRGRGVRQRDPHALGALQGEVQILLVQFDPEAGREGPLDHALTMDFENPRRRKPAHQGLANLCRVGAHLGGEYQRLRYRLDVERDDDLVGDLRRLPVPVAADEGDVLTHLFEYGLHSVKYFLRAADHDREAPRLGADLAARNGRIEIVVAGLVDPTREFLGRDRRDRTHVDDDFPWCGAETLGDAARPEQHFLYLGGVGHHGDDDIGLFRDLARAFAYLAARGDQIGRNVPARIEEHFVSPGDQICGHRPAHDSQSNKADRFHLSVLIENVTAELVRAHAEYGDARPASQDGRRGQIDRFHWPASGGRGK